MSVRVIDVRIGHRRPQHIVRCILPSRVLVGQGGMNREYTRAEFERVADTLLRLVPEMELASDIICGERSCWAAASMRDH